MSRRCARGFTLLETLICIAIVGVLIVVSSSNAVDAGLQAENRRTANRVETELSIARSQAIRTGRSVTVAFDAARRRMVGPRTPDGYRFPPGFDVQIVSASEAETSGRSTLAFMPDGVSSGGEVVLLRGQWRKRLKIDWLTGHVQK